MRFVTRFYFFGIIFITVLFISIHAQATVIYVDESVTGTGSSWAAAYGDLQPALSAASSGDSIWVAQGVYKPTATSTNRTATFQLINGVALFGGFPTGGGDGTFSARDVSAYSTILSGDIDSNDSQTPSITDLSTVTGNTTNSLHVVTGSNTDTSALLDGFTVTAGCANSDGSDGGGMYNVIGSPTIRSCTFRGNHAEDEGGGMYNYRESSPIISDCLFADNYAGDNGGGMENRRDSHAVITNCIFSYNRSADHGAGMYNDSQQGACNPSITHCRFDHNSTEGGFGGGLCNRYPGVAVIDNCTFEYNTANGSNAEALGGGMQNDNGASPIVRNCDFTNNSARYGGGMYNRGLGIPCNITISHCLFQGNSTTDYGGGLMFRHDAHGSVSHCVISGDSTSGDGGGFVCGTDSNVLMSHCTITGNYAGGDGENGGIYNFDNSSVTVNNCIVWDNNGTQIYSDVADSVTVNYSTVMGGWSGPGGDNQTTTPLFVTDINSSDAPTVDGNFHLQSGSPAIDVGSNSLIPPDSANVDSNPDPGAPVEIDLDGNARIFSATVDMGPYEYFGNSAPYVADPMGSVKKSGNFSYFGYDLTSVFNDIDGDLLSFSFASPTDTTIVRAFFRNDSLIILSRPNLTGKDSVYVQADDGNGETVIDSLKITVSDVNDDPTVAIPMSSVNKPEDFSYFGYDLTSVFNDTDGDPLSFSFVSPTDTTIVRAFFRNDSLIIHSRPNQSGKDSVYVQADDGNGGTVIDSLKITVSGSNDDPTVAAPMSSVNRPEDFSYFGYDLTSVFNDTDGDLLSFSFVSPTDTTTVRAFFRNDSLIIHSRPDQSGKDSVYVQADDGNGGTVIDSLKITVSDVNDDPTVADPMSSVNKPEDFSYFGYDLTSVFNDIDGDPLSFSFVSPTDTTTVRAFFRNDSLIILSRPNQSGKDSVYVQADDGNGGTVIDSLKIAVSAVNDDPTVAATMGSVNRPEDFSYFSYDLTSVFNDTEGDPLSFSFVSPTDTTIVRAFFRNDSLIIHSRPNQSGKDSVYVQADDGNGGTVIDSLKITVSGSNDDPTVAIPMGSVNKPEDFSYFGYDLTSVFNDIDGDPLSFSFISPTDTTIVRAFFRNDSLIILSRPDQSGKDSVYVRADDGNGGTVIDSLKITVSGSNDDPTVAIPMGSVNKPEDFSYFGYDLTSVFNDIDGDPLSFSFVSPTDTTIVRAFFRNDSLIILSRSNLAGKDSVYVQADDGNGGTVTDSLKIIVSPSVEQQIPIAGGRYCMFSLNRVPSNLAVDVVTQGLDSLKIITDDQGDYYIPDVLNTIGDLNLRKGYIAYLTRDDTLTAGGLPIGLASYPIQLDPHMHNMIPYHKQTASPIATALAAIADTIYVVQDDTGDFWVPDVDINLIDENEGAQPGKAYRVYIKGDDPVTFVYSAGRSLSQFKPLPKVRRETEHFTYTRTGLPYNLIIEDVEFSESGARLHVGDEIAVYDGDLCVGALSVSETDLARGKLGLTAWKGDSAYDLPGYTEGNEMHFRVWFAEYEMEVEPLALYETDGNCFGHGMMSILTLQITDVLDVESDPSPTHFALGQNFPNPFLLSRPAGIAMTVIRYQVPSNCFVEVQIFNVNGQLVRKLAHEEKDAGVHTVAWDGLNDQGNLVGSGVYLYRFFAKKSSVSKHLFKETKRMILMR